MTAHELFSLAFSLLLEPPVSRLHWFPQFLGSHRIYRVRSVPHLFGFFLDSLPLLWSPFFSGPPSPFLTLCLAVSVARQSCILTPLSRHPTGSLREFLLMSARVPRSREEDPTTCSIAHCSVSLEVLLYILLWLCQA